MGFRLIIVEDDEQELRTCRDSANRFKGEKECELEVVECKNVEEAFSKLDNTFDGAIVDLKLAGEGDEGNEVVNRIHDLCLRIPIVVFSGTPDAVETGFQPMEVLKKGETTYHDIFEIFWGIRNTGLTRIMGGRGVIEKTLAKVFRDNLLPQRERWVDYGVTDSKKTESALLRHTLNHLLQLLDEDVDLCFPEEMYLIPPLTEKLQTGSIVKQKSDEQRFVVLNPACDLVTRNGECKIDRVLVVGIESQSSVFPDHPATGLTNSQKGELRNANRNKIPYYHWLPKTKQFVGGFLNFRKIESLTWIEFNGRFEKSEMQVSPPFVKDIVARFSSYYGRQGQPDIDAAQVV